MRNGIGNTSYAEAITRLSTLTDRERQVLEQVAAGNSNKQIARNFNISHRTIEVHRARIMEKLGAASAVDLGRIATLLGETMVSPSEFDPYP
ncbi:MAG: hypothetical protein JNL14_15980 [Devosia sp.]|uniref:response regulator transcription factor n=1 Tax=Devosia sp. TaxID=1871048 RepID=UPI001A3638D3|nr:hypothetical protein [Devosia sp.]